MTKLVDALAGRPASESPRKEFKFASEVSDGAEKPSGEAIDHLPNFLTRRNVN
jgi:hypothetical protein